MLQVLKLYEIKNKVYISDYHPYMVLTLAQVIAIMSDNATNTNTMMQALEELGVPFVASEVRVCCLAHIIDLAATKVYMYSFPMIPDHSDRCDRS